MLFILEMISIDLKHLYLCQIECASYVFNIASFNVNDDHLLKYAASSDVSQQYIQKVLIVTEKHEKHAFVSYC